MKKIFFPPNIYTMASRTRKHSRSHKRSQKRGRRRSSRRSVAQRGGYPASAWGWQLNNLGDGWTQFMNTMKADTQSNLIAQNKSVGLPSASNAPAPSSAPATAPASGPAPAQKGGRRRRYKKGGNWNTVLNQAAVPAALWAMQYKTKRRRKV
jgi:hypothetical protein